jgi:cytoplasmic iron level regulating protein YaaA (DUF328/UPF0246 family)
MEILINSSKTMVSLPDNTALQKPALQKQAKELDAILKGYSVAELAKLMHLSPALAAETHELIKRWNTRPLRQSAAIDAFRGDIYRGLVAQTLSDDDRCYARGVLRILSGLYGILRPFDAIMPYRLELMYPVSGEGFSNLYQFWGKAIAAKIAKKGTIVNLASQEYFRTIQPYVDPRRVIEPQFMVRMTPEAEITFAAVYAKVARGAFARWLITSRLTVPADFPSFTEHGYCYVPELSTPEKPLYLKQVG